jgi:hypothetical protein
MPDIELLSSIKDLAPASVAIIGIVLIAHHLVKMIQLFADRHMKFMDRLIDILDKHSGVITGITNEMRSHGEIISAHTDVIRQVKNSMEVTSRIMDRFDRKD